MKINNHHLADVLERIYTLCLSIVNLKNEMNTDDPIEVASHILNIIKQKGD